MGRAIAKPIIDVSKERGCAIATVHNHLMELWGSGEAIDIHQFV
jgi:hypothetical protein